VDGAYRASSGLAAHKRHAGLCDALRWYGWRAVRRAVSHDISNRKSLGKDRNDSGRRAMKLGVEVDVRKAQMFLRSASTANKRATAKALNLTATAVRVEAADKIKEKRDLKKSVIKDALRIVKAAAANLEARVTASGKPIPMRQFSRVGKRGVTARIEPKGKRTRLEMYGNKAFVNQQYSPTVFVRTSKKRLPIEVWPAVPGIPRVFVQDHVIAALKSVAATVFPKRYKEQLNYQLNIRPNLPKKPADAK